MYSKIGASLPEIEQAKDKFDYEDTQELSTLVQFLIRPQVKTLGEWVSSYGGTKKRLRRLQYDIVL